MTQLEEDNVYEVPAPLRQYRSPIHFSDMMMFEIFSFETLVGVQSSFKNVFFSSFPFFKVCAKLVELEWI